MKYIDKKCEHKEPNCGDTISVFYFCKECGTSADREEDEEDDYPCNTCASRDSCDGWDAQFCCTLCYYYNDEPDCENCNPMDI